MEGTASAKTRRWGARRCVWGRGSSAGLPVLVAAARREAADRVAAMS